MVPIPEELLEQVERGNVLLFIGQRVVRDAQGRIAIDQLAAQLATLTRTTRAAMTWCSSYATNWSRWATNPNRSTG
jgi:hypothetical protein